MTRKRKSRSSAAEMIRFLKEFSEKRGRVEEEKITILKSMQEDFFSHLKDLKKQDNTL